MSIPTNYVIEKAFFRPATPEEVQKAKGNLAWRCVSYPWTIACKVMGTFEMFRKGANILAWKTPYLQDCVDRFSYWVGYNQEQLFIKNIFSFYSDRYFLEDKKLLDAFFKHHRNDEIFVGTSAMVRIFRILQQVFPEDTFTKEDFMFTCKKEATKKYRALLHSLLNPKGLDQFATVIQKTAEDTVANWYQQCKEGNDINITQASRLFASRIITQLMFNADESSREIAEAVNFINAYVIKLNMGKAIDDKEKQQFEIYKNVFKKAVEGILNKKDIPLFNQDNIMTPSQRKAMVFLLFFAGQETTASLLNYLLWQLAQDPQTQKNIYTAINRVNDQGHIPKEIEDYFKKAFHEFQPVYGVGRMLKVDTCLEYKFQGKEESQKYIFYEGQFLASRINTLAEKTLNSTNYNDWHAFGSGVHHCPGEKLAVQEILHFILALVSNYEIDTKQKEAIPIVGLITTQLAKDVFITMKPRKLSDS